MGNYRSLLADQLPLYHDTYLCYSINWPRVGVSRNGTIKFQQVLVGFSVQ